MVGVGTVLADDPQLTVRMVPGASPARVVLDSTLRIAGSTRASWTDDAPTTIVTTERSRSERGVPRFAAAACTVEVVGRARRPGRPRGSALARLRGLGIEVAARRGRRAGHHRTAAGRLVDRIIVAIAPLAHRRRDLRPSEQLDIARIADGIRLSNRTSSPSATTC